jgi:CRISPR system Cascade subunit CasD|uniref:CRISPR-associated protein, Cas5 n=1 Tax=Leptospirillum ferrodiazotrophum TaxID=412449 RepID=C6HV96_9BACT|nr:MAG: CRISPR-associated protein, Cas5 [Leptospirillum ferrodiazotrophum]
MSNPYLLLWLEAPLQSWGFDSKFGRRETLKFPTRSGVVGLVCSALGAGGEQRELLAEFSSLRQTVISFVRSRQTENGKQKLDREPLLRDFQMVGSGYDDRDPWMSLMIPKTISGGRSVGGGTKMTYRFYLQDTFFAVIFESLPQQSLEIAEALRNPVWDLYLGRKNCVPTDFIYRGTFETQEEAEKSAYDIATEKNLLEDFRVLDGVDDIDECDEVMTLNDIPVQFGMDKRYRDRRVGVRYAG